MELERRPCCRRGGTMAALMWLRGSVRRNRAATLAEIAGIAVAVAMLSALATYLAVAKRDMTRQAAADVAVDWQVKVQTGADPRAAEALVASQNGVTATESVEFASSAQLRTEASGTVQ